MIRLYFSGWLVFLALTPVRSASHGYAATVHPLATAAALEAMKAGGNAVPGWLAALDEAARTVGKHPLARAFEGAAKVAAEGFVPDAGFAARVKDSSNSSISQPFGTCGLLRVALRNYTTRSMIGVANSSLRHPPPGAGPAGPAA